MYSICNPFSLLLAHAAAQTELRPDPRQSPLSRQHAPDPPDWQFQPRHPPADTITVPRLCASKLFRFGLPGSVPFISKPSGVRCPPDEPVPHHLPDPVRPGRSQKKENLNILISANSCPPLLTATVSTKDVNN